MVAGVLECCTLIHPEDIFGYTQQLESATPAIAGSRQCEFPTAATPPLPTGLAVVFPPLSTRSPQSTPTKPAAHAAIPSVSAGSPQSSPTKPAAHAESGLDTGYDHVHGGSELAGHLHAPHSSPVKGTSTMVRRREICK